MTHGLKKQKIGSFDQFFSPTVVVNWLLGFHLQGSAQTDFFILQGPFFSNERIVMSVRNVLILL